MSSSREELQKLLEDMLALRTAKEMGIFTPPVETVLQPIKVHTRVAAAELLNKYEREMLYQAVKETIVKDVKRELVASTRASRKLDLLIGILTLVLVLIISAAIFLFVPDNNIAALKITYWIMLLLTTVDLLLIFFAKYLTSE